MLSCFYANTRSIKSRLRMDELKMYIKKECLDVVGITETWLDDSVSNSEISIENYSVFRKDRRCVKDKNSGGVLLYVKSNLLPIVCDDLNEYSNESIWCKIVDKYKRKVFIGVVYKSPSAEDWEVKSICSMFEHLKYKSVVVMGDFNYGDIDWINFTDTTKSNAFLETVMENFWTQHVLVPTREKNILDLIFSSEEDMVTDVIVREHFNKSDHNCILFKMVLDVEIIKVQHSKYNFFKGDYKSMCDYLLAIDWDSQFTEDINKMYTNFLQCIDIAIEKFVPKSIPLNSFKYPSWMTKEAINLREKKLNCGINFRKVNYILIELFIIIYQTRQQNCIKN